MHPIQNKKRHQLLPPYKRHLFQVGKSHTAAAFGLMVNNWSVKNQRYITGTYVAFDRYLQQEVNTMRKLACILLLLALWGSSASAFAQGGRSGGSSFYQLTTSESQYLTNLREEEKLARDVYITLQQRWGLDIFVNISMSEQQHMDAIKNLLDKYGLADPAHPQIGVFTDQNLQMAYQALVARGSQSVVDALLTGGYIEELDLSDLEKAMANTSHSDLLQIYSNLMKGSRNHLRAFAGRLEDSGMAYDAQVLTQEQVDAILNTPMERGGN